MKVCLCLSTFKRILAAARRGGFKGIVTKTISKDSKMIKKVKRQNAKIIKKVKKSKSNKGGKRKQSAKQKAVQARLTRAAHKCKGKGKGFRPCMKRELKKRR